MSAAAREGLYASRWYHEGIKAEQLPASLSRVEVRLVDRDAEVLLEVRAGLAGVEQLADGTLRPLAAWALCEGAEASLWSRFAARHSPPPAPPDAPLPACILDLHIDGLNAFYSRFDGARLEGGALTIRAGSAIEVVPAPSFGSSSHSRRALRIGEFADGSFVDIIPVHSVCPHIFFDTYELPPGLRFLEDPPLFWNEAVPGALERRGYAVAQRHSDRESVTVIAWSVLEFFHKLSASKSLLLYLSHADSITLAVAYNLGVRLARLRARQARVTLETREDGLHFGRLDEKHVQPGARYFLLLRTPLSEHDASVMVPQLSKIAAWNDIAEVVGSTLPGVALRRELRPPRELFAPAGTLCFALMETGSYWQKIVDEKTIAIYLPPPYDPSAITVELIAMTLADDSPTGNVRQIVFEESG